MTFPVTDANNATQQLLTGAELDARLAAIATAATAPATQPISAVSLPLPNGAATASGLTAIVNALGSPLQAGGAVSVSGTVPVSGTFWQATQPVSAVSLPLPSGASTSAKQDAQIAAVATIGTRAYAAGSQLNVTATSNPTSGLAATEVLLHATTRCFVRAGATATAAAGIPLEAGEKFHMRLTSGQQVHVIRDTADGVINIVPVA